MVNLRKLDCAAMSHLPPILLKKMNALIEQKIMLITRTQIDEPDKPDGMAIRRSLLLLKAKLAA